jgi:hypothetical protein
MSKQKLIEKLESAKVDSRDYDNGLNRAIDLIKSHDFQEPQWRSCLSEVPEGRTHVIVKDQYGDCGVLKTDYWGKHDFTKHDLWHDLPPPPVPQPSEEMRAIEAEIAFHKERSLKSESVKNHLWVLEQRLKEAKGER